MAHAARVSLVVAGFAERLRRHALLRTRTLIRILALALAGAVTTVRPVDAASARIALPTMGTIFEATVVADDDARARELCQRAVSLAREWDDLLTTWRSDGALERLNGRAGQGDVTIDPRLAAALRRMLDLSRATGGAFDPSVGNLVRALRAGETPPPSAPAHAVRGLAQVLTLNRQEARLAAGIRLDAGGVGKGIALDAVADFLTSAGATAWFLDFGGSSQLARGRPESASAWTVAIAGLTTGAVHGFVDLTNASLSTSRALAASDAAGAIVDPRTGRAVTRPRLATVVARDASTADAWSTALVVRGREGLQAARAAGVAALVEDAEGLVIGHGFPIRATAGQQ